ncbi:MAG: alpha/beta hydrolase fold domain-containing protein [Verrucomicrobia bacterium]|nr:alpha/beta hydrolase fold domain-containing protein [Verrucomicrobiota bacterium]
MEIIAQVQRAVRFIRHHAAAYGVDPHRLGVSGGSSGGHLSLMLATRGGPGPDDAPRPRGPREQRGAGRRPVLPCHRSPQLGEVHREPRQRRSAEEFREGLRTGRDQPRAVEGHRTRDVAHLSSHLEPAARPDPARGR